MATEKDLYDAFLDFSVQYLKQDHDEPVNEKIFDSISKVVLKMDISNDDLPDMVAGSLEEKKLSDLKKKHGVE